MGFSLGLIGLPNTGKSTIFNALTGGTVPAENFPFCTVEPNVGVAVVPDERLDRLGELFKPGKLTHTRLEFMDVAGLVEGASRGEGLGNQFLSHIRGVQALGHVVRCFEDGRVSHVSEKTDPAPDAEVVNLELLLSDVEILERRLEKLGKLARTGDRESLEGLETGEKILEGLHCGAAVREQELSGPERALVAEWQLLSARPMIYIANLGEGQEPGDAPVEGLRELARRQGVESVEIYGRVEEELSQISDPEERALFRHEMGLGESGLEKLGRVGYNLLGLITFFTVVGEELKAWTIPAGTPAVEAAGRIHSDMARGFIKVEVIGFESLAGAGDLHHAREAGLLKIEGRDYPVQDGDILHIKFHV